MSLSVRRGEIVGIAGVAGNGQSELIEALAGTRSARSGRVRYEGRDLELAGGPTPREIRRLGVAHVPEDRRRAGVIAEFTAEESAILGRQGDPLFSGIVRLRRRAVRTRFRTLAAEYDIRPADGRRLTSAFSGGNQQKIVVARELDRRPDLLLAAEPTRGVDVGAVELVHRRLLALRDSGAGILLVSSDLDEILAMSDRILVMRGGRIAGELAGTSATSHAVGVLMTGVPPAPA